MDFLTDCIRDPDAATTEYEDFKCSYVPMVVEAVGGGWGKVARGVWSELAKTSALAIGELETERTSTIMLRRRLSMTLHRENARACLRRIVH